MNDMNDKQTPPLFVESVGGLRAALAAYAAQYGRVSVGDQHPDLPEGAVRRIEAVVDAACAPTVLELTERDIRALASHTLTPGTLAALQLALHRLNKDER